jgi:TrmH family RNA methyltransferase
VGFIARAMKNFGLSKLFFSGKKFVLETKAFECAAHAKEILEASEHIEKKGINDFFDIVIGTTAKPHLKESSPRIAISPRELGERLSGLGGRAAIVFGREDTGLSNEELDLCDLVVSIPTDSAYSTLNISHAAAILFYELTGARELPSQELREAKGVEKEALLKRLDLLLDSIRYPNYKKRVSERIFRKVIGRAGISAREAHTLAGIFKEANDQIKRLEKRD